MFTSRRVKPSFFNRFISFVLVFTLFLFLNFNFDRKKVKAIEPVTLTYSMYLLIGGLATLCGIKFASIPDEARYDFVSGGFEAIKDVAEFAFADERGIATKLILNESTVKAFLKYVQSKEGTSLALEDDFNFIGSSLDLSFTFTKANQVSESANKDYLGTDLCSFVVNKDCKIAPRAYCAGTDSISSLSLYGSSQSFSKGDIVSFKYLWRTWGSNNHYILNMYRNGSYIGEAYQGRDTQLGQQYLGLDFLLKVDTSLIDKDTFKSFLNKTVLYPDSLTDVRGIEDYNKIYDKTVGQQSIEVDGSQSGVDIATPIDNSNTIANDVVFPSGIEEGIEIPGLKINTGEGSIESAPDLSQDETLEHKGILQKILDWLGSLVLDLMDFLLGLLDKLIDMLKSLLISLFVPTTSISDIKDLVLDRLSVPIFSAPGEFANKEPLTFTFPYASCLPGIDETEIVITLDQPWFLIIRELFSGFICYLLILFAHRKISSLYGGD